MARTTVPGTQIRDYSIADIDVAENAAIVGSKLNIRTGDLPAVGNIRGFPVDTPVEADDGKALVFDFENTKLKWVTGGGGGLSEVSHDGTLSGKGTSGEPLSVVGGGGVQMGSSVDRPAPGTVPGTFYLSTDLGILELSDGAFWYPIMMGGGV